MTAARSPEFEDCIGIFQGGGCRAAAYAGAYKAAVDHGVHFDELAGASAGAIVATLIAAGGDPDWLEERLRTLRFESFLVRPSGSRLSTRGRRLPSKVWNLLYLGGVYSSSQIEEWMEEGLRELIPTATGRRIQFDDLPKPVSVIASDLLAHRAIVWSRSLSPAMSVAEAVRSSCSLPFFFQPHVGRYVDGGMISNLPLHVVANDQSDQRRVLAFCLIDDKTPVKRGRDFMSRLESVAGTVVGGAQDIQATLQPNVDVINIRTGDIRATDFLKMTDDNIEVLIEAGRGAVNDFFGQGMIAARPLEQPAISTELAFTLSLATQAILSARSEILISSDNTKWAFDLFAALLLARTKGVVIRVVIPVFNGLRPDEILRRETLRALGCAVLDVPADVPVAIRALVCDAGSHTARALVSTQADLKIHSRYFSAPDGDEELIALVGDQIRSRFTDQAAVSGAPISFRRANAAEVIEVLRSVEQYSTGPTIELQSVPLHQVDSWAQYAHVYKQRQQEAILRTLREFGFEQYEPYEVHYGNGQYSLAMPVVVEQSPNRRYTVVNGLSRLIALARERQSSAFCAVVSGVTAAPPAPQVLKLSDLGVRVGVRGNAEHRYPGFAYHNVRQIEKTAHRLQPEFEGEAS